MYTELGALGNYLRDHLQPLIPVSYFFIVRRGCRHSYVIGAGPGQAMPRLIIATGTASE